MGWNVNGRRMFDVVASKREEDLCEVIPAIQRAAKSGKITNKRWEQMRGRQPVDVKQMA